jgi:GT2 family glycosyltransferase
MRTLLLCVHYRSEAALRGYLTSLAELRGAASRLSVVVVDNSPGGAPLELPEAPFPLRLVVSRENPGYLGGAARGFREAHDEARGADFVAISNVDLRIDQPDFLDRLEADPGGEDVGILAPAIRSGLTGADQNPFLRLRPSPLRMHAYKWIFSSYAVAAAYERAGRVARRMRRAEAPAVKGPEDIYAAHGSFFLLSRAFFERGGTLDYPVFLFNEEIHLAEQARALGLRVVYRPDLEVRHEEHGSIGRYRNRAMVAHARHAARFCADRYFAEDSR